MTAPLVFLPRTVEEAVDVLDSYDGEAKTVAGGTALSLMIGQRLVAPAALVSLQHVPDLNNLSAAGGAVHLGALVRHADVARHGLVRRHLPLLAEAFAVVGNAQVRAAATVGGVLAEADYASDPPAAFLALDATVTAQGPGGSRTVGIDEFFLGFYQTSLSPAEVITGISVPALRAGVGSTYLKYSARSVEDRPCVGVAAVVELADDGSCRDLRVAVGAASDVPVRFRDVEGAYVGRVLDATDLTELGEAYAERMDPVSDIRGSGWYRREMVSVWVRRALEQARLRARAAAGSTPPDAGPSHTSSQTGART